MYVTDENGKRAAAPCKVHGIVHSRPKQSKKVDRNGYSLDERSQLRRRVRIEHGNGCIYCGAMLTESQTELDRIVPSCAYILANVLPACRACNNRKNDHSILSMFNGSNDLVLVNAMRHALTLSTKRSPYESDVLAAIRANIVTALTPVPV